jgi:Phage integrase family
LLDTHRIFKRFLMSSGWPAIRKKSCGNGPMLGCFSISALGRPCINSSRSDARQFDTNVRLWIAHRISALLDRIEVAQKPLAHHDNANITGSQRFGGANGFAPWRRCAPGASKAAERSPPVTFHILRHIHGSHLAMQGVPMRVIAKQLGRSDKHDREALCASGTELCGRTNRQKADLPT